MLARHAISPAVSSRYWTHARHHAQCAVYKSCESKFNDDIRDTIRHGLQKLLILSYDLGRIEIRILYYINIIILLNVIILSLIYCVKWL